MKIKGISNDLKDMKGDLKALEVTNHSGDDEFDVKFVIYLKNSSI